MSRLILVPLAAVLLLAPGAHARSSAPTTVADDVRLLASSIEQIHPNPFRSVSRDRFESEVNALARRAPTLSRNELLVGVLRVIALLGDRNGHTGLFPGDPAHSRELHFYPLRLYDFADGLYVVDAVDRSLVRGRLVAIEGKSISEVFALVEPLVPRDNASNLRGLAPHYALTAEVLDGLGIVDGTGPAEFTLERPDGRRVDVALAAIPASRYVSTFSDALYGHYPSILPRAPRPLYLASSGKQMWAKALANGRAVYFGYNAVVPPSPAFVRKLGRLVKGKAVRRVIVDVRLNGGGDNTTYGPLTALFGSSPVNRRGKLYLLGNVLRCRELRRGDRPGYTGDHRG